MIRAVFLDRDGVVNRNRPDYVKSWEEFEFLPNVLCALHQLTQLGWPIIVVTNQSIIGRKMVSQAVVDDVHQRMQQSVASAGGCIVDIFCCPHHPDDNCDCRKPHPGLLLQAAARYSIDLQHSYLIGDAESDMQAAHAVNCEAIFVKSGRGNDLLKRMNSAEQLAIHIEDDLESAVKWIMSAQQIRYDDFRSPSAAGR